MDELALQCYGVEVRVRDVAELGLVAYLHSRLPAEFVAPTRAPRVSVEYTLTLEAATLSDGSLEEEYLVSCDGFQVFAASKGAEVYDWVRDDIHQSVARRAADFHFFHAGVVGWRGMAIVIPGKRSSATSALVGELLRLGAVYYSDSFAVLDASGRVHPYRVTIGQSAPPEPLPIGLIVAATLKAGSTWQSAIVRGPRTTLPLVDAAVLPREASAPIRAITRRIAPSAVGLRAQWADAVQAAQGILERAEDQARQAARAALAPAQVRTFSRRRRLVAVVTAQHRFPLTADEQVSLRHLREYLGRFDRYLIGPSAPPPEFSDFNTRHFSPRHFSSVATYSRLLVSERFYRAFADYEYILIYQLDALVFSSDLEHWCRMDWDYVGAPWFDPGHPRQYAFAYDAQDPVDRLGTVGNGGLSLRKVDSALTVLTSPRRLVDDAWADWAYRGRDHCQVPEDVFWSFIAPQLVDFCIPRPREALQFAFETELGFCFRENEGQLPFGCHGWASRTNRPVWEPFVLR